MRREEFIKKYSAKSYLGDGLYVSFDGYHFILSTERDNGLHWVGLEPSVVDALIEHRKKVYEDASKINKKEIEL
jgi:hypothetical protein